MIPKITQDGPNIIQRFWCSRCGTALPDPHRPKDFGITELWRYCPVCGDPIEYEKTVPVQWSEQDCTRCGRKLISEIPGTLPHFISTGEYVGGHLCRTCQEEHCVQTDCSQCEIGKPEECRHKLLKKYAVQRAKMSEEDTLL